MKSNLTKRLAIVISLALICTSFAIPSFADTVKNSDSMNLVDENGTYTTDQTNTAVKKETFTSPSRTSDPSNNHSSDPKKISGITYLKLDLIRKQKQNQTI